MARKRSTEVKVAESRFTLNGKDWNEYTEEEQDAYRAAFTDRVMEIAFRPGGGEVWLSAVRSRAEGLSTVVE